MAYVSNRLSELGGTIGGLQRMWTYQTADSVSTVLGAGYISDATNKRMQVSDLVLVFTGTLNTTGPDQSPSTHSRGTVSEFASDPSIAYCVVDSISAGAATLKEVAVQLGSQIGFFGQTPASQPHSANENAVSTAAVATVATTAATSATGATYGYTTTTQANAIVTSLNSLITQEAADRVLLNQLQADLVTLGLIKGTG
jgi:hypothetical protein